MPFRRKKPSEDASEPNSYEIWQEKQAAIETAEIAEIERNQEKQDWFNPVFYLKGFWSALLDDNRREAIKVVVTTFAALGLIGSPGISVVAARYSV